MIADLECYGLLMLMETEGFKSGIEWIAGRLNVDPRIKGSEGEQNCTGENPISDNPDGH